MRQHPGDPGRRRWFACPSADLYVWEDGAGAPLRLEFCYGKPRAEHMLAWDREQGLRHAAVDDGEALPFSSCTPIAVPGQPFDAPAVALELERVGADLEPRLYRFVLRRLLETG